MSDAPKDIAIFWDFASCPAPEESSGFDLVNKIRSSASQALPSGNIKSFKAYLSVLDHTSSIARSGRAVALRSELQSSGVSLTDVPGLKETADKMIIVDMLAYAFDRPTAATTLILITADPTFAYGLSVLRMRNHRLAIMAPDSVSLNLLCQASMYLHWDIDSPVSNIHPSSFTQGRRDAMDLNANDTDRLYPPKVAPQGRERSPSRASPPVPRDAANMAETRNSSSSLPFPRPPNQNFANSQVPKTPIISDGYEVDLKDYLPSPKAKPSVLAQEGPQVAGVPHATQSETPRPPPASAKDTTSIPIPHTKEPVSERIQDGDTSQGSASDLGVASSLPSKDIGNTGIPPQGVANFGSPPSQNNQTGVKREDESFTPLPTESGSSQALPEFSGGKQPEVPATPPARDPRPFITPSPFQAAQTQQNEKPPVYTPFQPPSSQSSSQINNTNSMPGAPLVQPTPGKVGGDKPTSSVQGNNNQTLRIPPEFQVLVDVLLFYRTKGVDCPGRSIVAIEIANRDRLVYQKAGTLRFAQYSLKAQQLGIIQLGGYHGDAWISLRPAFV